MSPPNTNVIDFADITNQIHRREMSRIFEFNLMLVGLTGVGKSTLVTSLFQGCIKPEETIDKAQLNEYNAVLEEHGVKLLLNCIETSNFDSHDNKVYVKYIEDNLKSYFVDERRMSPRKIEDKRVHCCLYLIQPYGKMRLRDEDIETMKALHEKVNLIPIIAKADTFNSTQLSKFKENILADLRMHNIKYFQFAYNEKEDEERSRAVKQEAERFPFAVVAAEDFKYDSKRAYWIRETISGEIDITDKRYDFDALSKLLVRHCMLELIDSTHVKHYAKFKSELLQDVRNLESLGLEPYEIFRIQYYSNPKMIPLEQQLNDMEAELKELRERAQSYKVYPRTKPEVPREKPAYLRGKLAFINEH